MRVAAGLLVWAAVAVAPPAAWAVSDLAGRQSEAERQQAALRDRIDALQKEIDTREAARKEAADALKESESAISRINLRLRELGEASRKAEAELAGLEKQVVAQQAVLQKRRAELADQLRTQYTSGLSPWTALLSGDDPQQLGRNLGYLDYVSRARAQAVHALREDIARLAALQGQADARRDDIQTLVAETSSQKAALVEQQKTRATLLAKLEGQIAAQRAEAGKLGRDDQRLSHLIDDLGSAIARQAEEDARRRAAEEARRKEEEARQAEAARRAEAARQQEAARQAAAARWRWPTLTPLACARSRAAGWSIRRPRRRAKPARRLAPNRPSRRRARPRLPVRRPPPRWAAAMACGAGCRCRCAGRSRAASASTAPMAACGAGWYCAPPRARRSRWWLPAPWSTPNG